MIAETKKVIVARPHGFCVGVSRAVRAARAACSRFGKPVYCLNEIVHNEHVVGELESRGMRFVSSLCEVPEGSVLLFSAHGVEPGIAKEAARRKFTVIDATCPFVHKVHAEVRRFARQGYVVLLAGYRNHEEVRGVAGEAPGKVFVLENPEEAESVKIPSGTPVAFLTQTTLSRSSVRPVRDVLLARFPDLAEPDEGDICYATENRQEAVRGLAAAVEYVIVLGSPNSSNSRRLVETALSSGRPAALAPGIGELHKLPLADLRTLGLTSGASTPETLVEEALAELAAMGFTRVENLETVREKVEDFPLPKGL
ncbi:MAG: 4-hydroxy-3-methylbut-2-enyl diphosphate reductase [Kiritimatiellia bacterium]